VVHAASEILGFNYVIAPDVRGKVTVQTSGRIPQEDVFNVLLAVLEVHGFTAVKSGNLYKIVRIPDAAGRAVPTFVGTTLDPSRDPDEVITQIVPVRFASVNDLLALVRPLMSARGSLIGHRETNVLILTDVASNIARLLDIIRLVDVEVATEELQIIQINFADARELAQILAQLVASGRLRTAGGVVAAPGAVVAPTPAAPTPTVPGQPPRPPAAGPETSAVERPPLIIAEPRSNSLIVHARKNEMETIKRLIAQLDVNIYGGKRVFIYFAESAKAKDLAATLNSIYGAPTTGAQPSTTPTGPGASPPPPPGVRAPVAPTPPLPGAVALGTAEVGLAEGQLRFIADEATNSVIVTTYPRQWQDVEATIKQLDKQPRQVLIEVLIAEITLTDDTRLGLDWAIRTGSFRLASTTANTPALTTIPTSPPATPGLGAPAAGIATAAASGAFFGPIGAGLTAFAFESEKFFAILNILASENRVNVISNPHVMTSENKKAVINVSRSVPVITSQQTGTVSQPGTTPTGGTSTTITTGGVNQTVEYKDAGVILTVTPRIGERGTVALDIKQE
ncbi:MAG: type II secretion system secretin GspD, partial [Candidatus Rokuibacteriota bacterium]